MLLEVQHVRKEFQNRTHALTDASFSVSQGDFVSVIGPSGAGKTTLFRILNGSLRCDGGAILVNGVHFESADRRTRRAIQTTIGTIYQDFALVENATCRQNVLNACLPDMAFLPAVCGFFGKERVAEADALLDRVGLADKVHEPVKNLSGGQKQRVAIARALMRHPALLLADEPVASLDPVTGRCDLDSYVQDALDLIEFANGDVATKWGKLRADMGHPASFNLKFIGIGNEQWGPEYPEHLEPFIKAIRKAYPDIKIIGSSGPDSEGKQFEYLWPEMKRLKVDLVDEHFYRPENWFLNEGARYDNYDRKGPKVFAGEYACHGKGKKWNHFNAALLEAAFMTGLERNADIVHMATYAPLFAHVEGWQWRPDMIWFDNLNSVRTVSYYVQQLYGHHKGTNVLSLTMNKKPVTGAEDQNGLFASAVYDKDKSEIIVKVANTSDKAQPLSLKFEGLKKQDVLSDGRCIKLRSADLDKDNTIEQPFAIQPQETPVSIDGQVLNVELEPKTFVVYIFKKG